MAPTQNVHTWIRGLAQRAGATDPDDLAPGAVLLLDGGLAAGARTPTRTARTPLERPQVSGPRRAATPKTPVEPSSRSVLALWLKETDHGEALRWAFGVDAVTIGDSATITDLDTELTELSDKRRSLLTKRVLSSGGDEVGHIVDIDFDGATGVLITILFQDGGESEADRLVASGPTRSSYRKRQTKRDPAGPSRAPRPSTPSG